MRRLLTNRWIRRVAVMVACLLTLPLAGLYVVWAHPSGRIISGGRVWRCSDAGGSTLAEAPAVLGLDPAWSIGAFGAVGHGDGLVLVARLQRTTPPGTLEATFLLGSGPTVHEGALDANGRSVARQQSVDDASKYAAAQRAARECLRRHLPEVEHHPVPIPTGMDRPASSSTAP